MTPFQYILTCSLSTEPSSNIITFKYNFFHEYSVVLDHPLDAVFLLLGQGDTMDQVVRLSDLCSSFELGDKDTVTLTDDLPLADSRVRTFPSAPPDATGRTLPRRAFRLIETVPVLFGLFHKSVEIVGTQTWDDDAKVALYESITDIGVQVWKLRRFEEVEDGGTKKTRVSETIRGKAPSLLKLIVQKETERSHT